MTRIPWIRVYLLIETLKRNAAKLMCNYTAVSPHHDDISCDSSCGLASNPGIQNSLHPGVFVYGYAVAVTLFPLIRVLISIFINDIGCDSLWIG